MESRLADQASAASRLTSAKSVRLWRALPRRRYMRGRAASRRDAYFSVAPHRTGLARPTIGAYSGETIVVPALRSEKKRLEGERLWRRQHEPRYGSPLAGYT